jgi:hypothetical protein
MTGAGASGYDSGIPKLDFHKRPHPISTLPENGKNISMSDETI